MVVVAEREFGKVAVVALVVVAVVVLVVVAVAVVVMTVVAEVKFSKMVVVFEVEFG